MEFKTKTGNRTRKLIERDKKVISPSLTREYEFAFKNGKGVYLFDLDGKKYIDFAAGVAVNALGYNNKFVLNSIKKQLNKGIHIGFSDFYCEKPVEFAELLLKFVPKNLQKVFFSNSGTESVECAMKLAKWHTRRKWCISFHNSFHGRCYDEQTEILTERGWKFFKELNNDEKVLTLNLNNQNIEYQKPVSIYSYNYNGEMIYFKSSSIDLLVTPNHNMLINLNGKFSLIEANKVRTHMKIPRLGNWTGCEKKEFIIPSIKIERPSRNGSIVIQEIKERVVSLDLWVSFFGFWLADGWTASVNKESYNVGIAQKNPFVCDKLEKLLNEIGFKYNKTKKKRDCYEYIIQEGKQLWSYLNQFGDSHSKFVPQEIKILSPNYLKLLLDWMFLGDGTIDRSNKNIYFTCSKKLADDVQEIFLKIGSNARIYWGKRKTSFGKGEGIFYEVRERKRKNHLLWTKKNSIRKLNYEGKVYCCEVPNHVIYVRRNGYPAWCGNSYGSLSLTDSKKVHKDRFEPFLPVRHVSYPDVFRFNGSKDECVNYCLKELEKTISGLQNDVAAIFFEPIQGEGGYIVPPVEFVKGVREICDKYSILLVADEVQSGCYRTGKFLCMENYNVKADIVCLSKAIGGGLPIGATLASNEVMDWVPGSHACFYSGAKVILADGSRKEIGKIVNNKLKVNVLSYNRKTGKTELKKVINWFKRNSKDVEWFKIITTNSKRGFQAPNVTKEHKYFIVDKGWVQVKDLKIRDKILIPIPYPNKIQEQVIIGSILGDGGLSRIKEKQQNGKFPHLTLGHKKDQLNYLKFKFKLLENLTASKIKIAKKAFVDELGYKRQAFYYFRTINHSYLSEYRKEIYVNNIKNRVTKEILNKLDPLGLAILYMDDGSLNNWMISLSTACFDEKSVDLIISFFKEKYGLIFQKEKIKKRKDGKWCFRINLSKEHGSEKFMRIIAPWIIDCMNYKIRPELRSKNPLWKNFKNDFSNSQFIPTVGEVLKIIKSNTQKRSNELYDIEVEDNHNYFIPTALVSNSTLGGSLLGCSAGIATLNYFKKKKIWNNVNSIGDFILKKLNKMKNECEELGDVRGIGLMIGNEFVDENKWYNVYFRDKLLYKLKDNGLICLGAGKSAIRFCPPLIINKKETEKGLKIFEKSLKEINK